MPKFERLQRPLEEGRRDARAVLARLAAG